MSTSNPTPAEVFSVPLNQIVASGVEVENSIAALFLNGGNNTAGLQGIETFTATPSRDANGDLVVTVNVGGRNITFTETDLSNDGTAFETTLPDGTRAIITTGDGTWEDIAAGNGKFTFMLRFTYADVINSVANVKTGVMGLRTSPSQLPRSGTATYFEADGLSAIALNPADTTALDVSIVADANLTMDFANDIVSGSFTNIRPDGQPAPPGELLRIAPAPVSNGAFSSTLTSEGSQSITAINNSNITGAFYGDAALEVGGHLSFEATTTTAPVIFTGVFGAKKQ